MSEPKEPTAPAWHTVVMICNRCEKRDNNPCQVNAGELKAKLKDSLKDLKPHVRVVESSCLGMCPTGGVVQTVTVGKTLSPCAKAVASSDELVQLEQQVRASV